MKSGYFNIILLALGLGITGFTHGATSSRAHTLSVSITRKARISMQVSPEGAFSLSARARTDQSSGNMLSQITMTEDEKGSFGAVGSIATAQLSENSRSSFTQSTKTNEIVSTYLRDHPYQVAHYTKGGKSILSAIQKVRPINAPNITLIYVLAQP